MFITLPATAGSCYLTPLNYLLRWSKNDMNGEKPVLFSPSPGKHGITELHFAAYCGDGHSLTRCLAAGEDPNKKDEYRGYTPLHWLTDMAAAGGPRIHMLDVLRKHGADLDSQTFDGDTALMLAARSGSYCGNDLVAALLTLGADPRVRSSASTALHEGIWDMGLVTALIAAGASLNERDAAGLTALDAARARLATYADEGGRGMEEVVAFIKEAVRKK
jgi:ankyrin repeat protein